MLTGDLPNQTRLIFMKKTKKYAIRSEDEIKRMKSSYDEGKTLSEVGVLFGLSRARVGQIFRLNNFKIRKKTASMKFAKAMGKRRIILDRKLLVDLYTHQKLSMQKIAAQLSTSGDVVHRNLRNYKISIRTREIYYKSRLTPELLRRLYIDENLTAAEIAKRLNYSISSIGKNLKKFGIKKYQPVKRLKVNKSLENRAIELNSKEFLTVEEIAKMHKIRPETLRRLIREGAFPNAFRQRVSKSTRWIIPSGDLENFSPRKKGVSRIAQPTLLAIRSRGKYARAKIKKFNGYGKAEITEIINLEKHGLGSEEIAVRFRLEEQIVADILNEAAARQPRREKQQRINKELKRLPEKPLIDLYVNGEYSIDYILQTLNTNYTSLYISLRHYGIPLRDERLRLSAEDRERLLYQLFIEEDLTAEIIADRLGQTLDYVRRKINELKRRLRKAEEGGSNATQL